MMRTVIVGAVCLLLGGGIGYWAAGSYAEHLAGELRRCEAQLDRAGK